MIMQTFAKQFSPHLVLKKHLLRRMLLISIVVAAAVLLFPHPVLAVTPDASATSSGFQDVLHALIGTLSVVYGYLQGWLWPILLMIGSLLQNDLLFGGTMEKNLLVIWTNIRDVVNVFFVLVLVGIAFYNVVRGGGSENYQLKIILPKLVIGLVAVNFSFLGVKLLLDGVNVISTGIFALPNTVAVDLQFDKDGGQAFCKGIYGKDPNIYQQNIADASKNGNSAFCTADGKLNLEDPKIFEYFKTYNAKNAALVLALNMQHLNILNEVQVPKEQATLSNVVLNFLYEITLFVIFGASFVALLAVLIVRLVVMWLFIVLAPLYFLKTVLPENLQSSLGGGEDIGKMFVKHAIVPIPIALTLSIGFMLLQGLQKVKFPDAALNTQTLNLNLLTSGISTLQDLIVAIASAGFIWTGVFNAAKDTHAAFITDSIKSAVGGVGKTLAKLPTLIPFFPTAHGNASLANASLAEVGLAARELEAMPGRYASRQAGVHFPELFGPEPKIADEIRNAQNLPAFRVKAAKGYEYRRDKNVQESIGKYFEQHKHELLPEWIPQEYRKGTTEQNKDAFLKALAAGNVEQTAWDSFYTAADIPKYGKEEVKPGQAKKPDAKPVAGAKSPAGGAAAAEGSAANPAIPKTDEEIKLSTEVDTVKNAGSAAVAAKVKENFGEFDSGKADHVQKAKRYREVIGGKLEENTRKELAASNDPLIKAIFGEAPAGGAKSAAKAVPPTTGSPPRGEKGTKPSAVAPGTSSGTMQDGWRWNGTEWE